jgi:hypothetical protein
MFTFSAIAELEVATAAGVAVVVVVTAAVTAAAGELAAGVDEMEDVWLCDCG